MNAGLSISATPPDVLPLLPLGAPVFHSLPGRALVLEELAPAVGDGIVVLRLGEGSGGNAERYRIRARPRRSLRARNRVAAGKGTRHGCGNDF